jgi:hypothetical protein
MYNRYRITGTGKKVNKIAIQKKTLKLLPEIFNKMSIFQ